MLIAHKTFNLWPMRYRLNENYNATYLTAIPRFKSGCRLQEKTINNKWLQIYELLFLCFELSLKTIKNPSSVRRWFPQSQIPFYNWPYPPHLATDLLRPFSGRSPQWKVAKLCSAAMKIVSPILRQFMYKIWLPMGAKRPRRYLHTRDRACWC